MKFPCVECGKIYDPETTRANYVGFCSIKCEKAVARSMGWKPKDDHYYSKIVFKIRQSEQYKHSRKLEFERKKE